LVYRAAALFLEAARLREGVRLRLDKRVPLAAGLGGGSGDAATTLMGLNELFDGPLGPEALESLAGRCGSDVPFFLHSCPAIGTGRGEQIEPLKPFRALAGKAFLLAHPGFGVSTAWAYAQLGRFPQALEGRPGRARRLAGLLQTGDLKAAGAEFYNSLEGPVLEKYPILALYQEFLRANGVLAALMSGSGSTTFALVDDLPAAQALGEKLKARFGPALWTAAVAA
jgi:4-diphosphocytidyl-2-C-methyl-D-erythritol kinase